jgi:hypothetical protein
VRLVSILIAVGVLLVGATMWHLETKQQQRLEGGVRILAQKMFEPFVAEWAAEHADDYSHEILIDIAAPSRFRKQIQQASDQYDAFLTDVYGGYAAELRRQGRLRHFFGGPLKLLIRADDDQVAVVEASLDQPMPLQKIWPQLTGRTIGVLPLDTALGRETGLWLEAEQVKDLGKDAGPELRIYSRTLDLLQALHNGHVDAAILRADLQGPPNTEVLAWHKLYGQPQEHYEMGMLVMANNAHRELIRAVWLDMQPQFLQFAELRQ